jgi:hypothetical protein
MSHLVSLFPVVAACDYYDEWSYRGGRSSNSGWRQILYRDV